MAAAAPTAAQSDIQQRIKTREETTQRGALYPHGNDSEVPWQQRARQERNALKAGRPPSLSTHLSTHLSLSLSIDIRKNARDANDAGWDVFR